MILSGDFNVKFSLPEAEPLIAFLKDELKLEMNTNRNVLTTNSGRNHASFLPGRQFAAYATVPRSIVPPWRRRGRIANAKRHCFNPKKKFENKRHKRSRRKIREGIYTANKKKKISKRNRRRRKAITGR